MPHCLIVEISYLLPQNVRKNMRLQSLKGLKYIVRNRNTVFRTSHTLCRFTRSSNDRVTKQATRYSKCQRSTEQQQSIKCFKIHSKDLLQNNDFHITSSIFLLSSVLVFYFFLILFFNSIVYRFFIARIFGVLPEYFRDWGGCRPPPRPPGSYAYAGATL